MRCKNAWRGNRLSRCMGRWRAVWSRPMATTDRAMFACSRHVGFSLAEFHNSGRLAATPRPAQLLQAIACYGDPVAWYVMQNDLRDINRCDGFLMRPLDVALGVCSLEATVAEVRAIKMRAEIGRRNGPLNAIAGIVGVALVIGLIVWWRRRQGVPDAIV